MIDKKRKKEKSGRKDRQGLGKRMRERSGMRKVGIREKEEERNREREIQISLITYSCIFLTCVTPH